RETPPYKRFPGVTPLWDNSARHKTDAYIFIDSTPELYEQWLRNALRRGGAAAAGEKLVFVNAWNEWAEGNHLEPDLRHGPAGPRELRGAHCRSENAARNLQPLTSDSTSTAMSAPRVSIITPVFNGAQYLEETAQGVFGQTLSDWEWLLVDDGSTDASVAMA